MFLNKFGIMKAYQYGFQKNKSAINAVFPYVIQFYFHIFSSLILSFESCLSPLSTYIHTEYLVPPKYVSIIKQFREQFFKVRNNELFKT